jgi:outer membrane protein TolC
MACAVLLTASLPAAAAPLESEAGLVERFLAHGPQRALAAAAQGRAAALTEIGPAVANPTVDVRREQSFGAGTEFSTTIVGGTIDLEIGGRYGLRREAGRLQAEAVQAETRAMLVDAVCGLRRQALAARVAGEESAVAAAWHERITGLESELARLVQGGEKAPFDLRLFRMRLAAHDRTLQQARARADAAQAALGAWIGEDVPAPVAAEPATPPAPDVLVAQAIESHPALQALQLQARAAEVDEVRAGRWWVPDLGLYGAWRGDTAGGSDLGNGFEAGVAVAVPLFDTGGPERAAARAEALRARADLARAERDLRADFAGLHAELTRLGAMTAPPASDEPSLLEMAVRRYRAGEAPLGDLLDTLEALEADEIARLQTADRVRGLRLALACRAGRFAEPDIAALVEGAVK